MLDDAHHEGGETLMLSSASSGRLTDGETTATIENRNPLPRAPLARFGRTSAVEVVEHVEERWQGAAEAGRRGPFRGGRELRLTPTKWQLINKTQSTCHWLGLPGSRREPFAPGRGGKGATMPDADARRVVRYRQTRRRVVGDPVLHAPAS